MATNTMVMSYVLRKFKNDRSSVNNRWFAYVNRECPLFLCRRESPISAFHNFPVLCSFTKFFNKTHMTFNNSLYLCAQYAQCRVRITKNE